MLEDSVSEIDDELVHAWFLENYEQSPPELEKKNYELK